MILYLIKKIPFLRTYYFNHAGRGFVNRKLKDIEPHLRSGSKILDIGSGNGLITFVLREKGFDVTPLDIAEGQYHSTVKPVIYNGRTMPFADNTFDSAILLTILHHTTNQEEIIRETVRVCKQLIIMEDIYETGFQKYYLYTIDSLINLFYSPCPHTNRTDSEWKKLFAELNLKLTDVHYRKLIGVKQAVYVLQRE